MMFKTAMIDHITQLYLCDDCGNPLDTYVVGKDECCGRVIQGDHSLTFVYTTRILYFCRYTSALYELTPEYDQSEDSVQCLRVGDVNSNCSKNTVVYSDQRGHVYSFVMTKLSAYERVFKEYPGLCDMSPYVSLYDIGAIYAYECRTPSMLYNVESNSRCLCMTSQDCICGQYKLACLNDVYCIYDVEAYRFTPIDCRKLPRASSPYPEGDMLSICGDRASVLSTHPNVEGTYPVVFLDVLLSESVSVSEHICLQ